MLVASALWPRTGSAASIHSVFLSASRMRCSPVEAAARKRRSPRSVRSPTGAAKARATAGERAASSYASRSAPGAPRRKACAKICPFCSSEPSRSTRAHSSLAEFMVRFSSAMFLGAPSPPTPSFQRREERGLLLGGLGQPVGLRSVAAL